MSLTDGSFIKNYKRVSDGAELNSEQVSRLTRFFEASAAEGLPEFQYMLLAFEYYLATGEMQIKQIIEQSQIVKELIEKRGVLEHSTEFLERSNKIEQSSIEMSKNMSAAFDKVEQMTKTTEGAASTIGQMNVQVEEFRETVKNLKKHLEERLTGVVVENVEKQTAMVAENAKKQMDIKAKDFTWSVVCLKSAVLLSVFTIFAATFFFMGLLSYGQGFPEWIVVPAKNAHPFYSFLSIIFGLPMSWVFILTAGFLGIVWLFDEWKSNPDHRLFEFVKNHKMVVSIVFIALIAGYAIYHWYGG